MMEAVKRQQQNRKNLIYLFEYELIEVDFKIETLAQQTHKAITH